MARTRRLVASGLLVAVAGAAAWTAVAASRGLPAQVVRVAGPAVLWPPPPVAVTSGY